VTFNINLFIAVEGDIGGSHDGVGGSKTGAPMSWASMTATPEPVLAIIDDMVEVYKGTSTGIYIVR
jgi:hypothetical protein